jgi:hypothetical protein
LIGTTASIPSLSLTPCIAGRITTTNAGIELFELEQAGKDSGHRPGQHPGLLSDMEKDLTEDPGAVAGRIFQGPCAADTVRRLDPGRFNRPRAEIAPVGIFLSILHRFYMNLTFAPSFQAGHSLQI